ncbi:NADH-quinone oxidoreductase subunit L [Sulfurospirillum deleyianum]|uniref:Proton-translocating NADH-quinone oxidoreductase, chain L n=1 Tax=Sulfurospirillum deleyianum (strain ATCC 51133 / DSM 6946 / 5175) TaxID=525898 RepID=D1AZ49_SULD5|nr:NADH-quinone oxidoreductase subunit L [Sulfurospirillum deleyianum]ACZ11187.1 proton-translocating NADH-quinone oxidoreductase, chain L [Sulfurospirillum deleyianum DSM 6946]
MENYLYTALFAPLISALFGALFAARPKALFVGIVASCLIGLSMLSSLVLLFDVNEHGALHVTLMEWIVAGNLYIPFGFVVDEVSVIMMVTVTLVSTVVHIYSIGYMDHDKSFNRFFSYLSAFVFSMMILVMSDNFAGLFIGWEGVGLCSWLLIGFWYHKHSASWAANEAFIMNRIADLGMLMGLFLIYWNVGSLQYDDVFATLKEFDNALITTMGIFLFIGAMGKSAQFPLHTWLADAMEGPTPVSALIHAATMVTAGVYLVIRAGELYSMVPDVGFAIASLGAFVALFAASMALVNNDLKRIIAYSTLSQLGYMFVAAGLGAYWIALFHLMTHAFFKSLLFLGAGNVMHAMHDELNIKKMGGLYGSMKATAILMSVASVALAGIYPFAGFFSKDKILEVAFNEGAYFLWFALFIGAGLTAFYSFRLVMLVFFGEKEHIKYGVHPHEAQPFVIYALLPLGLLAVVAGLFEHSFEGFVTRILSHYEIHIAHGTEIVLIAATLGIALSGIAFAIYMYKRGGFSKRLEERWCYKLLSNQYYIPKLYELYIMRPFDAMAKFAWLNVDMKVVDSTVDFIAKMIYGTGEKARKMQSGNLSDMLRWMVVGIVVLLFLALFYRPMA